jgi:hypothetical protein
MPRNFGPTNLLFAATDGSTVTFDLSNSDLQIVTFLAATARTIALSNVIVGQQFTLLLKYGGANTLTWFSGISWQGGTTPTATAVSGKTDTFTFICTAANTYIGYVAGQNA